MIAAFALTFVVAFLAGSIPFGYVIGWLFYRTDIRTSGSGNIGAMNALRTLGKTGAVAVLLLDSIKGFAPAFIVHAVTGSYLPAAIAAAGSVIGHCFSPWLRWKGGKGVATSFGAIFALSWQAGIVAVAAWLIGAGATTFSSVGSMLGNLVAPLALYAFTASAPATIYGAFAAVLIIVTHRDNIARLRTGAEHGITFLQKRKS